MEHFDQWEQSLWDFSFFGKRKYVLKLQTLGGNVLFLDSCKIFSHYGWINSRKKSVDYLKGRLEIKLTFNWRIV